MICPRCQSQVADGVKFCGVCGSPMPAGQTPPPPPNPMAGQPSQYGAPQGQGPGQGGFIPPNQYEEYTNSIFGNAVPKAELHNPVSPLKVADMTISIDGQLVPVVDVMLGNQLTVYFEHHILLW
ncbi:MAG TPA: zinc ribbon domain-containing protein, partial [Ktedonobacteraceae bacterium]|nr:zinc ribbon domain-containing protein [Ktedonobacteraceae bacterium]